MGGMKEDTREHANNTHFFVLGLLILRRNSDYYMLLAIRLQTYQIRLPDHCDIGFDMA